MQFNNYRKNNIWMQQYVKKANSNMKFGSNPSMNYFGSSHNQPKKIHQETPSHHLEPFDQTAANNLEIFDKKPLNKSETIKK